MALTSGFQFLEKKSLHLNAKRFGQKKKVSNTQSFWQLLGRQIYAKMSGLAELCMSFYAQLYAQKNAVLF
jgi:hypothetical protein